MTEGEGASREQTDVVSRGKLEATRLDDVQEDTRDFLEGLLHAMEIDGTVEVDTVPPASVLATIEGRKAGILIGRKGRTLEALQELLRAAISRHSGPGFKVSLDIEGYREKRRQAIEEMARAAIIQARETGEAEMEPMSAYERKLVHDIVAETEGVTSFSEGEGTERRVFVQTTSPEDDEGPLGQR